MRKAPKNPTADLAKQQASGMPGGRGPLRIEKTAVGGSADMTVPGMRLVEEPPGKRHERSAAHFADHQKIK